MLKSSTSVRWLELLAVDPQIDHCCQGIYAASSAEYVEFWSSAIRFEECNQRHGKSESALYGNAQKACFWHEMLQKFLSRGVLMPMDIYLHTGKPMKTPSPRGCRMCQGYLMDA